MTESVSVAELIHYIEDTRQYFAKTGEELNEGAMRVLGKLRDRTVGIPIRRTYVRTPDGYAMWDVITDAELVARGYVDTDAHTYGLTGSPSVLDDSITYWTSEKEGGRELWVGEPLAD
jgi:hypothetical protein